MNNKEYYLKEARKFLTNYYREFGLHNLELRLKVVRDEINNRGIWSPTATELAYGGKAAWRNSNRCIGRLFYKTLKVLDRRSVNSEEEVFDSLIDHLYLANNGGRIQSVLTVFRARGVGEEIRIWNAKLIRYAGYEAEGRIIGDPEELAFTKKCMELGWRGKGTPFDLLPVVIQIGDRKPKWFELPKEVVLEVELTHPDYVWFKELGLKWYAVPVITDMVFKMGGIEYPAAPFNGWYMETEIGSRNFGDVNRYNMLPIIAEKLNLNRKSKTNLWKDRALVELNRAVLHSFREAGVRITDHHTASKQFMQFCKKEEQSGRQVSADWSWIVPPMSGSTMDVFHNMWANSVKEPNFYYRDSPWNPKKDHNMSGCPFHISTVNLTKSK